MIQKLLPIILLGMILLTACGPQPAPPADDTGWTSEGVQGAANSNNRFAFDLYSELNKGSGNIFVSPWSISTALAMAYEGARGETAEQMRKVFYFNPDDADRRASFASMHNILNPENPDYLLSTANALWVQESYPLLEEYKETVRNYYAGESTNVDFEGATEESRKTINSWVEEQTNDKIKDLFPAGSLDASTRLVLTNAIYFKGTWVKQFDKGDTRDMPFRVKQEGEVQVPMMSRTDREAEFGYLETDELRVLEMLYEGDDLSMLVLLPRADDISPLENSLSATQLEGWRNQLLEQRVDAYIPKFTFETKYFMSNTLSEMGMPLAFSEAADLSGMDGTTKLFIQAVIHQAFVDVNEEGTEAAAATGVSVAQESMPPPVPVFRADHPFIFIIQERETGNILFLGKVVNPLS